MALHNPSVIARWSRRVAIGAALGGPLAMALSIAPQLHAQTNQESVSGAMFPAVAAACPPPNTPSAPPQAPYCASFNTAPGVLLPQLAPDKLTMMGSAALDAGRLQFGIVRERQLELRRGDERSTRSASPIRAATTDPNWRLQLASLSLPPWGTLLAQDSSAPPASTADATNPPLQAPRWGSFIRIEGDRERADPTAFDPGFQQLASGFTAGADYRVGSSAVLGVAIGRRNIRSTLDTTDGTASGSVATRNTGMSLYGSWFPGEHVYVDGIVGVGRTHFETRRNLPVLADAALGNTVGRETSASLSAGFSLLEGRWNYGGHVRVSHDRVSIDGFTEQPNPTASNLTVQRQRFSSLVGSIGTDASYAISRDWGVLIPNARLELNRQFRQDKTRHILATLPGAPGSVIDIASTPVDRSYVGLDLGIAAHFGSGRTAALNYGTVLGRSGRSFHALSGELRLEF